MENFLEIVSKPDNIPIIGMIFLVGYYTWLGLKQAFENDRLIREGKRDGKRDGMTDEVLRRMQE